MRRTIGGSPEDLKGHFSRGELLFVKNDIERVAGVLLVLEGNTVRAKAVGVKDGNDLDEIKALARSLQIEKSIIFTGRIPHDEVVNYIGMADIGISYIPINENYNYNPPLKTFEYLACGLPTIATRTESNCRIIKDGFNGILVDDTPEDVETSIINLVKDKNKQAFLRKNARKSIMAFDFEHLARNCLVPLYEELLRVN